MLQPFAVGHDWGKFSGRIIVNSLIASPSLSLSAENLLNTKPFYAFVHISYSPVKQPLRFQDHMVRIEIQNNILA